MYKIKLDVSHPQLGKSDVVKGNTLFEAEEKAKVLFNQWDSEWTAKETTENAEKIQNDLEHILLDSLECEHFPFEDLKDHTPFDIKLPKEPSYPSFPIEPQRSDEKFNPKPDIFTKISKKRKTEFEAANQRAFENAHDLWQKTVQEIKNSYAQVKQKYEEVRKKWEKQKTLYESEQKCRNDEIDRLAEGVASHKKDFLEQFYNIILEDAPCPFEYEKEIDVEYQPEGMFLIVDMFLPTIDIIPTLKSVTYIKSRKEFKKTVYPESYLKKKYESVIYQLVLQALNLCFNNPDAGGALKTIAINGRVRTIDKATGNTIEPCILSITIKKTDFEKLNLTEIDPKTWFKSAKGVSAASISNIAPVAPLVEMSKNDKRFVDSREVANTLDSGTNLAAMDWQEFEHLIRELFEMEFSVNGGEVKITQASRDGGVDAIAFDPDPIRGGKIVIQAKRYTNVVGVAAVRDLYGTVINEGASKGILVTTASYGSDAYKFAVGKPLTLLNGGNLMHLLEKHGYKAHIDLKEAKALNDDK